MTCKVSDRGLFSGNTRMGWTCPILRTLVVGPALGQTSGVLAGAIGAVLAHVGLRALVADEPQSAISYARVPLGACIIGPHTFSRRGETVRYTSPSSPAIPLPDWSQGDRRRTSSYLFPAYAGWPTGTCSAGGKRHAHSSRSLRCTLGDRTDVNDLSYSRVIHMG
jgi:hypothetical protein